MEITGPHSTRGRRLSGKTNPSHWFHGGHSTRQDKQNARVRVRQKQPSEPGSILSRWLNHINCKHEFLLSDFSCLRFIHHWGSIPCKVLGLSFDKNPRISLLQEQPISRKGYKIQSQAIFINTSGWGACMPQHACGRRRTICRSHFSPSTMWTAGTQLR